MIFRPTPPPLDKSLFFPGARKEKKRTPPSSPTDPYAEALRASFPPPVPPLQKSIITLYEELSPSLRELIDRVRKIDTTSRELLSPFVRGAYVIKSDRRTSIAIFKPENEVRGMEDCPMPSYILQTKESISPRHEATNEVIAAQLFKLPVETVITTLEGFFYSSESSDYTLQRKRGALMRFFHAAPPTHMQIPTIDPRSCERLFILDLATSNTDRREEHILFLPTREVVGIDHGSILPEYFIDPALFSWIYWPQAFRTFSPEARTFISELNFGRDAELIRRAFPTYSTRSLETMKITYHTLQQGVLVNNLPPFAIAAFLISLSMWNPSLMRTFYQEERTKISSVSPETVFLSLSERINHALASLQESFNWEETRALAEELFPQKKISGFVHSLYRKIFSLPL
jgi:hypothetical protein